MKQEPADDFILPTLIEIKKQARESLEGFSVDQLKFERLMKRQVSRLRVFPYQLCDGGAIVLRARLTLDLTPLLRFADLVEEAMDYLKNDLTVDLFNPPQRVTSSASKWCNFAVKGRQGEPLLKRSASWAQPRRRRQDSIGSWWKGT
ncbi:MAG: hypothetical protein SNJ75_19745 [Gemmataceae bacterium]